jgi:Xaa-Pro aminopeptidase
LTRIDKLRESAFTEKGYDGYLVLNSFNQLYFLGFPGTSALFIPAEGDCVVYVYGVNYEQAKAYGKDFAVRLVRSDENLMAKIASEIAISKNKKIVVDSIGVQTWDVLTRELPKEAKAEVNNSFVEALRMVKDKGEIELMRKAGELTSEGMRIACEVIKPGIREYEVAAEIEYVMRKRGSGPTAFETIVASGVCSAFPHGGCSGRKIQDGDFVVVDVGATFEHYCSDMTRTVIAGKASKEQRKIFEVVKEAQESAFQSIVAGVQIPEVDVKARKVISDAGYGEYFVHRLGHGVGLEVHESPSLGPLTQGTLKAGNVVTNEPGIYVPNFGGVRIEDTVLVKERGAEKLTIGSYEFGPES